MEVPCAINIKSEQAASRRTELNGSQTVCFVCTGNTCRSPMAAALYNHIMQKTQSHAFSCGLYACPCDKISDNAVSALKLKGVISDSFNPYEAHTARQATEELLLHCDMIIGMTEAHTLELIGRFPHLAQRIYSMPKPISDPFGMDLAHYSKCLEEIEAGIKELFNIEA